MRYVKRRCIGDQYQSLKVVTKGERMIKVVLSKAKRVRCVSSKMLSLDPVSKFCCVMPNFIGAVGGGGGALSHERIG